MKYGKIALSCITYRNLKTGSNRRYFLHSPASEVEMHYDDVVLSHNGIINVITDFLIVFSSEKSARIYYLICMPVILL
jgi:hypothetical protein